MRTIGLALGCTAVLGAGVWALRARQGCQDDCRGACTQRAPARAGERRGELGPDARLDERRCAFLEDDPLDGAARRLAEVLVRLTREDSADGAARARLTLDVSAVGPLVEPERGWEGVAGANRKTAEELAALLGEGELEVATLDLANGSRRRGHAPTVVWGELPCRRVLPDGSLDWSGASGPPIAIGAKADAGVLPPGRYRTQLVAHGMPRFEVDFELDEAGGRIVQARSLAAHPTDHPDS